MQRCPQQADDVVHPLTSLVHCVAPHLTRPHRHQAHLAALLLRRASQAALPSLKRTLSNALVHDWAVMLTFMLWQASDRPLALPYKGSSLEDPPHMSITWQIDNFTAFKDILETRKLFSKCAPLLMRQHCKRSHQ